MVTNKFERKTDFLKNLFLQSYNAELKLKINEYRFKHKMLASRYKELKRDLKRIKAIDINYQKQTIKYKNEIIKLQELLYNEINKKK